MSNSEHEKTSVVLSFRGDSDLVAKLDRRIDDEKRRTGFDLTRAQVIEAAVKKYLGSDK